MNTFLSILSFIGSLGLFLYGMKIMSEGLEKLAGDKMRNILGAMTRNRFMGVLTGVGVTALIQSSSATTVMVVSFVNAGLMTLRQAIGVIMGANIGTTVTAWIISFIGFKVSISALSLPLLAVALPLFFAGKGKAKNWGEFIFGFAFLFMGLNLLSVAAESLHISTLMAGWLSHLPCDRFWTIPLFVLMGALLTMLMQSSSASMAVTLMLFGMDIPGFGFAQAAALAMGQNIGTTITAFLASLTANVQAKRAALAHMFFNVFGVIVVLAFFYPTIHVVEWLVTDVFGAESTNMYLLSAFHTCFNLMNTLLLIGFVPQIERFVCWVLPVKSEQDEKSRLRYISGGLLSTSELNLMQAKKEISLFAERCHQMFGFVSTLLTTENNEQFVGLYSRIEKYEAITDRMEIEIATYLQRVSEGRLSDSSKAQIMKMMRQVDELESIGDSCFHLARTLRRRRENCAESFTDRQMHCITQMMRLTDTSLSNMENLLEQNAPITDDQDAYSHDLEKQINNYRSELKSRNLQDIDAGQYSYQLGVFYVDFICECEKLADYVINIVETSK
ncbi:MAG: Na/Pi cotransporter family protein [Paludibacteraceae bacterium]|nr:Na/Pi cotransporter family protein [Paludibacteraceae bacterium]